MNEREFKRRAAPIMLDESPMTVEIPISAAWVLVSMLQLASRHPGLSKAFNRQVKAIADQFHDAIAERHPDARELLEMGWNTELDEES